MPAFMLARLDRETRDHHESASADRARAASYLPDDAPSYRAALARVWGFEAAVEGAVATTPGVSAIYDLRSRHHMIALRQDLVGLGLTSPSQLPSCALALPGKAMDVPTALGFLYAIDRPALPAHIAASRLPTRYLRMQHDLALLGAACDRVAKTPQIAGAIVAAAHSAFTQMRTWFSAGAGSGATATSAARVARIARRAIR